MSETYLASVLCRGLVQTHKHIQFGARVYQVKCKTEVSSRTVRMIENNVDDLPFWAILERQKDKTHMRKEQFNYEIYVNDSTTRKWESFFDTEHEKIIQRLENKSALAAKSSLIQSLIRENRAQNRAELASSSALFSQLQTQALLRNAKKTEYLNKISARVVLAKKKKDELFEQCSLHLQNLGIFDYWQKQLRDTYFSRFSTLKSQCKVISNKFYEKVADPSLVRKVFQKSKSYISEKISTPIDKRCEDLIKLINDFSQFKLSEQHQIENYSSVLGRLPDSIEELKQEISSLTDAGRFLHNNSTEPLPDEIKHEFTELLEKDSDELEELRTYYAVLADDKLKRVTKISELNQTRSACTSESDLKAHSRRTECGISQLKEVQKNYASEELQLLDKSIKELQVLDQLNVKHLAIKLLFFLVKKYRQDSENSFAPDALREERIQFEINRIEGLDIAFRIKRATRRIQSIPNTTLDTVREKNCPIMLCELDENSVELYNDGQWEAYSKEAVLGIFHHSKGIHPTTRRRIKLEHIREVQ